MTDLELKIFRFNAVNPTIQHDTDERIELPAESSYLNVHIEFLLPEKYLHFYEKLPYVSCEKWADDSKFKVKFDHNVVHNHITQAAYAFVQDNYEAPALSEDMVKVLNTLYAWKIL